MTSYATIDSIEGKFAVCEVELLPFEESNPENFAIKETEMMDISLHEIIHNIGEVKEGDILLVMHDGKKINAIYYKDDEEKARRLEILRGIMS